MNWVHITCRTISGEAVVVAAPNDAHFEAMTRTGWLTFSWRHGWFADTHVAVVLDLLPQSFVPKAATAARW